MPRTLHSRLEALEARALDRPDVDAVSPAAEQAEARFVALVDRLQGQDPGPGAPLGAQIAARFWHDPAGAIEEIRRAAHASARARMTEPEYLGWCNGE